MNLIENELKPYLGGNLEIKNREKKGSRFHGGIKNLCITGDILKIELVWAIEFQSRYDGFEQSKWVHTPEIKEYSVNLKSCEVPKWETISEKTICLYSSVTRDTITFHLANGNGCNAFNPLDVEGCPNSLELELEKMKGNFLSIVDLNKIPKVDFGIEKIPIEEDCRFMRIDLWWKDKVWSFIRVQKNPNDGHSLIYYSFFHEVAEQYSLTGRDIEKSVSYKDGGGGGGFLWHTKENKIEIRGSSKYYGREGNRNLTVDILNEVLGCEVYEV